MSIQVKRVLHSHGWFHQSAWLLYGTISFVDRDGIKYLSDAVVESEGAMLLVFVVIFVIFL